MRTRTRTTASPTKVSAQGLNSRALALLGQLACAEGPQVTHVPGVGVARVTQPNKRRPMVYEPMILFLAQGRKRVHVGDEVFQYDRSNYLALSVPLPVVCEVHASPKEPLLALKLKVEPAMLAELLIDFDAHVPRNGTASRGIFAAPMNSDLCDAVTRLLECLRSPLESKVLGRQIVREIVFRVLQDEPGSTLRSLATRSDQFMRIARVLEQIDSDFAQPLGTDELAKRASMSISTFHHHFRAVTGTSPLQYLKSIRLHRARLLMIHEGHNAGTAAAAVGYESGSQFGREFKRLFGSSPAEDAAQMRSRLA